MDRSKHWCFTLNNHTDDDAETLRKLHVDGHATYVIFGNEVGESGTPHLQGFISLVRRSRMRSVKSLIGDRAHLEPARNITASIEYCKKDEDFVEIGSPPRGQGSRSDLESVRDLIRGGQSAKDVADAHFGVWAKYHKAIGIYEQWHASVRDWKSETIVYWGATGTGKSKRVWDAAREERIDLYVHTGESWFDGYTGQEWALFDDYNGGEFKLTYLLRLLDRYPMLVPVKGGYVQWKPKKIFITSNKKPDDWYTVRNTEQYRALLRRIDAIEFFE